MLLWFTAYLYKYVKKKKVFYFHRFNICFYAFMQQLLLLDFLI